MICDRGELLYAIILLTPQFYKAKIDPSSLWEERVVEMEMVIRYNF
jgi:hypothetical protein